MWLNWFDGAYAMVMVIYAVDNATLIHPKTNSGLVPVVQRVDNKIHRINNYPLVTQQALIVLTQWRVIYPLDRIIKAYEQRRSGVRFLTFSDRQKRRSTLNGFFIHFHYNFHLKFHPLK